MQADELDPLAPTPGEVTLSLVLILYTLLGLIVALMEYRRSRTLDRDFAIAVVRAWVAGVLWPLWVAAYLARWRDERRRSGDS